MLKNLFQWFMKLLGGFIPVGDKPVSEWLGKLLWVVGVVLICNWVIGFFERKPANSNAPTVNILPFAKVGEIDQSSEQKSEELKRKWWQPIPYVSLAGQLEATSGRTESGAKLEVGLRLDF